MRRNRKLTVLLNAEEEDRLERTAHELGVAKSTLARMGIAQISANAGVELAPVGK